MVVNLAKKREEASKLYFAGALFAEERFIDGWRMLPNRGARPHMFKFTREGTNVFAQSLCGRAWKVDDHDGRAVILEAGSFPRCKRCIAALVKVA